tara:strand:+ start:25037 stop:25702 length:666 start_codon:yes stop_codon:yes gene_type:complete
MTYLIVLFMVYPIGKLVALPIYRLWLGKVTGIDNIPKNEPFVIAANHASYYDALLLHSIIVPRLDKKIHALVNSYYWKPLFPKIILNWGECLPVHISKNPGLKNKETFKKAKKYLKNKELIQIFPEGTRSYDGNLKKAYNGAAKLALESKVAVLPIGIIGSNKVLPKGKIFPRFKRCEVKIGKLMYFKKYYGKENNTKILKRVTAAIMKEIAKLIGKKYNH